MDVAALAISLLALLVSLVTVFYARMQAISAKAQATSSQSQAANAAEQTAFERFRFAEEQLGQLLIDATISAPAAYVVLTFTNAGSISYRNIGVTLLRPNVLGGLRDGRVAWDLGPLGPNDRQSFELYHCGSDARMTGSIKLHFVALNGLERTDVRVFEVRKPYLLP